MRLRREWPSNRLSKQSLQKNRRGSRQSNKRTRPNNWRVLRLKLDLTQRLRLSRPRNKPNLTQLPGFRQRKRRQTKRLLELGLSSWLQRSKLPELRLKESLPSRLPLESKPRSELQRQAKHCSQRARQSQMRRPTNF